MIASLCIEYYHLIVKRILTAQWNAYGIDLEMGALQAGSSDGEWHGR